jgi:transcriptional regulator with XRE-family HTH domain
MEFGKFIEGKRLEKGITLRQMAVDISITPSYLSDIEKGRRYAPDKEKLEEIANKLGLNEDEKNKMFDLAGKTKEAIPPDLPEYIMEKDLAVAFLRKARKNQISDEEWKELIKNLDNNR